MPPLTTWFDNYSGDHQNATNQRIHVVCVPAILWSVVGLLWAIPIPSTIGDPGMCAGLAMAMTLIFYWQLSRRLALGMLVQFIVFGAICAVLLSKFGTAALLWAAGSVFVVAWIGQFVGHKIEGRRPSFFTDLAYLLIGPLWVLAKLYRKLGLRY